MGISFKNDWSLQLAVKNGSKVYFLLKEDDDVYVNNVRNLIHFVKLYIYHPSNGSMLGDVGIANWIFIFHQR